MTGSGCPICSGSQILAGFNDLATLNPSIAKEWHPTLNSPLKPTMVAAFTRKKIWWKCEKGHEFETIVANRTSLGRGCPICSNQKILVGFNDLSTTHPHLLNEWDYDLNIVAPESVFAGTRQKFWWKCLNESHSYLASGDKRSNLNRSYSCPYCNGKRILVGFNDLATTQPKIAAEWHPTKNENLTPEQVTIYSNKKAWWQCEKQHVYQAVIGSRQNSACSKCSKQFSKIEHEFYDEFTRYLKNCLSGSTVPVKWCTNSKIASTDISGEYNNKKVIIEYDGEAWHKSDLRMSRDMVKIQALLEAGYIVVRIRENKLVHLPINHHNLYQTNYVFKSKSVSAKTKEIMDWLEQK